MIEIRKEKIKGIPLLHVVKEDNEKKMLPLIIFIHGFTSAKEHNLHFAYLLAEKGFRVVLPDTILHGERSDERSNVHLRYEFWNIVIQTITELNIIKEDLMTKEIVDQEKIGVIGTSMGGIVTLGALTQYKWIKVAVSLMGSPYYEQFARAQIDTLIKSGATLPISNEGLEGLYESLRKYDLTKQSHLLDYRPLLFWHGRKDSVVPFQPTYAFYEKIKRDYEEIPSNLEFIADDYADHKVSREALLKTVDWFEKHLL